MRNDRVDECGYELRERELIDMRKTPLGRPLNAMSVKHNSGRVLSRSIPSLLILAGALTSTWTGVKLAGVNVSDVILSLAVLLRIFSGVNRRTDGTKSNALRRFVPWMIYPILIGLVVLGAQTLIFGLSLQNVSSESDGYQADSLTLGYGGPLLFLLRIFLATSLVAVAIVSEGIKFGRESVYRIFKYLAFGNIVSCAVAILDSFGITHFRDNLLNILGDRAVGLAFHPNSLAQSIVVLLSLSIWWFISTTSKISRVCLSVAICIQLYALFLSDSRGGIIVGSLCLVISLVFLGRGFWSRSFLVPACLLGVAVILSFGGNIFAGTRLVGTGTSDDLSLQQRTVLLEKGFEQFVDNPILGAGLGNGLGVMVPLLVLSSGGLIFLISYYGFILYPVKSLWIARSEPIIIACLLSIFGLLMIGFFNNSIAERFNFWPLIGGFVLSVIEVRGVAASKSADSTSRQVGTLRRL